MVSLTRLLVPAAPKAAGYGRTRAGRPCYVGRPCYNGGMTQITTLTAVLLLLALSTPAFAADAKADKNAAGDEKAGSVLYHVVHFKFKDSATKEQIGEVERAFAALKDGVPGIASLTWGTNVSPEKLDKGFTHCFVLAFASEKDRDAYLPHPDHKAFGKVLGPVLADVFVIDFWSQE